MLYGKCYYYRKSDSEQLRKTNGYYVDKTEILYELLGKNTRSKVFLFTRPQRFGKTLMMSMMENFFSITKDSRDIFEGLDIMKHKEFCDKYMNRYPVIFLSFKEQVVRVLRSHMIDSKILYPNFASVYRI